MFLLCLILFDKFQLHVASIYNPLTPARSLFYSSDHPAPILKSSSAYSLRFIGLGGFFNCFRLYRDGSITNLIIGRLHLHVLFTRSPPLFNLCYNQISRHYINSWPGAIPVFYTNDASIKITSVSLLSSILLFCSLTRSSSKM